VRKRMGHLPRLLGSMEQRPLEPFAFKSQTPTKKLRVERLKLSMLISEELKVQSCAKSAASVVPSEMPEMSALCGSLSTWLLRLGGRF